MSIADTADFAEKPAKSPKLKKLHPWPVRVMHWINAYAMIVMIGSGWGIYNDSVIFHGFQFPDDLKLGRWAAESLLWHFAGMWLLVANGTAYVIYGLVSGRFREKFLPIRLSDVLKTIGETIRLKISHADITKYNAVQKLLYIVVLLAGLAQVITGIAIWKPVQFSFIVDLFGDFQNARLFHFLGMSIIVGFMIVHIALAALVPRTLLAMITGGPRVPAQKDDAR